jgi:hypothetical protein
MSVRLFYSSIPFRKKLEYKIVIRDIPVGRFFAKQSKVDFENCLKKTHVSALVQSNLMFPKVNYENFGRSEGEKGRFPFEILRTTRE